MSSRILRTSDADPRSQLPSVAELLESGPVLSLLSRHPRPDVLEAIRNTLNWYRNHVDSEDGIPDVTYLAARVQTFLDAARRNGLRRVVNATGVILHTGLGRAVLPRQAVEALADLDGCCNLQIDLESGLRGKRNHAVEELLCRLTGAEAALVVNNNAAATLLILAALCAGKEVIVSRGQLIEIGGSFRLPDCIHQSGAILVEVGTTNKTHLRDYEAAIRENTAAIMRVNPSNYRVVGFSQSVPINELVSLRRNHTLHVIDDLGCGALVNLERYGLPHEPTVQESITAGADITCFSGDKLIGGPQAGIIVGRKEPIERVRRHPLTRMLRVGKLTDMALERTLRLFLEPERLLDSHPTLQMLTHSPESVKRRAQRLKRRIVKEVPGIEATVIPVESAAGGGALPELTIPSFAIAVNVTGMSSVEVARELRCGTPSVVARIHDDQVLIDMRTLLKGDDDRAIKALEGISRREGAEP